MSKPKIRGGAAPERIISQISGFCPTAINSLSAMGNDRSLSEGIFVENRCYCGESEESETEAFEAPVAMEQQREERSCCLGV
jgi:hypothetical protein